MFVDIGVPLFFKACYQAGADRNRVIVKVAGGSNPLGVNGAADFFRIGERNFTLLKKLLAANGIALQASAVGGHSSRTLSLDLVTGNVQIKSGSDITPL
jgi:chemotaxis protein CheD